MDETCDRCGPAVAARLKVTLPSGLVLTFCGHCAAIYKRAVTQQ